MRNKTIKKEKQDNQEKQVFEEVSENQEVPKQPEKPVERKNNIIFYRGFLLLLLANNFIWAKSFYNKMLEGEFSKTLSSTLSKFASKNPYPWYKNFLNDFAIPNSEIFSILVMIGEGFVALTMLFAIFYLLLRPLESKFVTILLVLALLTASFLSLNFWFASGWISSSSDSLNLLLFLTQITGIIFLIKSISLQSLKSK